MEIIKEDIQLTEWETSLDELISSLPITKYPYINIDMYAAITKDFSLFATVKLWESYNEIMTTARYCLRKGVYFNHKVYSEDTKTGMRTNNKDAQYAMNLHELKSAIVWCNSAMDYLLQVIYFGFGFHGKVGNNDNYIKELKSVRWVGGDFSNNFRELSELNQDARNLYNAYKDTFDNTDIVAVRGLANNMKHHGGFDLEEYPKDSHHNIGCTDKYGNMVCYNEITQRPRVSYQKIVEHLIGAHKAIIELGDYIVEQLGLSEIEKPGYVLNMDNPQRLQKFIYKKDDV